MTIKSQVFLRLLLLIPYLAWGISLGCTLLISALSGELPESNPVIDILAGITSFYTLGILLWGIPYTLLAAGLFFWSLKKTAPAIYKVFLISPFLLSVLILVEVGVISISPSTVQSLDNIQNFFSYALVAVVPSLVFGYVFVGLGVVIYQAMRRVNLLKTELGPVQLSEAQ